jgi:hypothetical protein
MTAPTVEEPNDRNGYVVGVTRATVGNLQEGFVTSRCGRARRFGASRNSQAAATAVRHVSIAAARST